MLFAAVSNSHFSVLRQYFLFIGVEVVLSGKAKCHWMTRDSYANDHGNLEWVDKSHDRKEVYFKTKLTLAGGNGNCVQASSHMFLQDVNLCASRLKIHSHLYFYVCRTEARDTNR